MKNFLATLIFIASIPIFAQSQESTRELYSRLISRNKELIGSNEHKLYPKISGAFSYGANLLAEEDQAYVERSDYISVDFRASYQTIGNSIWDQLWRYPEWGVGYYGTYLFSDTVYGQPNAIFAYIDIPFNQWDPNRKWSFSYSIAGGLSYNFRPNNELNNPLNTVIGSYNNVYIDLGLWANYRINPSFDAKMGLSFVHFSNGSSTQPQKGMNLVGPKIIIQHNLVRARPEVRVYDDIPTFKKRSGLFVLQAFGSKQVENHGTSYLNTTTALGYKWWVNYKYRWIAQVDVFMDGSNNNRSNSPGDDAVANYFTVGVYGGYEAVYNRWSFTLGGGVNVWRTFDSSGSPFYQRFGVHYRVWQGLALGVGLKSKTFAADYIEWSLSYNIF